MVKRLLAFLTLYIAFACGVACAQEKLVYLFPIRENIMPSTVMLTSKCLSHAQTMGADYVFIDMNTYGGVLDAADSIRTMLLDCPVPVMVYINNQAASAGALIAIAADSIYMRSGASIGAASVVDQSGNIMPDKYQSFMRSMMRATAEAHGKKAQVNGSDTLWVWHRDPQIAQAMVDPSVVVEGVVDSTKVLTFTVNEALANGYCEGMASSVEDALESAEIENYTIYEYKPTFVDGILGFLTNPVVQGILIMLMVGGIWFELQSPGIGFALVVSILAAALYFAPLYIQGLVRNWELLVFLLGVVLMLVELLVIPGFGVFGISGIVCMVTGLSFAMMDNELLRYIASGELSLGVAVKPFMVVIISVCASIVVSIWLSKRFLEGKSHLRERVVLVSDMNTDEGFVSHRNRTGMVGRNAVTSTPLRPAGRIIIDGKSYDASSEYGTFVDKGAEVVVVRDENGVLYVK